MQNLQQEVNTKSKKHIHSKMDQCIQSCLACYRICEQVLGNALSGNAKNYTQVLVLIKACAEICHTSAKFMMMKSEFHIDTCGVCAKVCTECADTCESLQDDRLEECILACRKCAESCLEMTVMEH